jgi:hypothetical protein
MVLNDIFNIAEWTVSLFRHLFLISPQKYLGVLIKMLFRRQLESLYNSGSWLQAALSRFLHVSYIDAFYHVDIDWERVVYTLHYTIYNAVYLDSSSCFPLKLIDIDKWIIFF